MEHVRHWKRLPRLPPSVDFDTMPLMFPLVAALGLVCKVNRRYPTLLQEGFLKHYRDQSAHR